MAKQKINQFIIESEKLKLIILDQGATMYRLIYKDTGEDLLLFEDLSYYQKNEAFYGSVVAPFAGRISKKEVILPFGGKFINDKYPESILHAGEDDVKLKIFNVDKQTKSSITLSLRLDSTHYQIFKDFYIEVKYELVDNYLNIEMNAKSFKPTLMNITSHAYWNLGDKYIFNHYLSVPSHLMHETQRDGTLTCRITSVGDDFYLHGLIKDRDIDNVYILDRHLITYESENYKLMATTNQPVVVVYNDCNCKNKYKGICFEFQKNPYNITDHINWKTTFVINYKHKSH